MDTLFDSLERAAAEAPEKAAVVDETRTLTYAGLRAAAGQVAAVVAARTDRPRVGILLPNSAAFTTSFFGILRAGRTPVPLNLMLTPAELAFCVADAGIDLILSAGPLAERAKALAPNVIALETTSLSPPGRGEGEGRASLQQDGLDPHPTLSLEGRGISRPDDAAVILYTSGTTGRPKGVMLTHTNLLADAEGCRLAAGLDGTNVLLGLLPMFHAYGLMVGLVVPAHLGATSVLVGRFQPAAVIERMRRHGVNVMMAVPSVYGALIQGSGLTAEDGARLRICVAGGEALPRGLGEAFERRTGCPLLEGYGMTETSPVATLNRREAHRPGTVGRPLPGVELRIVDPTVAHPPSGVPAQSGAAAPQVPPGAEGEVWIRGPIVMAGYLNRPEETAAALTADGWLRSGDLGRLDADGCLTLTGRLKDLIISGGENIAPREIEEALAAHPAVAEAVVIGVPDAVRGEAPKAFVVLRDGQAVSPRDLAAFCRGRIANFKVPREFEFLPAFPTGPTGKVNRRALREERAS